MIFCCSLMPVFEDCSGNPFICSEKYAGVRCYLIKRFPYKVFYRVEVNDVIILGVISSRRDPDWIKKRMER